MTLKCSLRILATGLAIAAAVGCAMERDYDDPQPSKVFRDGFRLCKRLQTSEKDFFGAHKHYGAAVELGLRTCGEFYCADIESQGPRYSATVYPSSVDANRWNMVFFTDQSEVIRSGLRFAGPNSEPIGEKFRQTMERD